MPESKILKSGNVSSPLTYKVRTHNTEIFYEKDFFLFPASYYFVQQHSVQTELDKSKKKRLCYQKVHRIQFKSSCPECFYSCDDNIQGINCRMPEENKDERSTGLIALKPSSYLNWTTSAQHHISQGEQFL